jgi:NAD(P)-dependent dehydrogenase (short-subunit alcohol dehydrogenase family)
MKGKIVLVTGADGGLGVHVTKAFLEAGATVIGASRKIQTSEFNYSNLTAITSDISTSENAAALIDLIVKRFGKLDVVVHTVGGFAGGQSVVDTDNTTFQSMFEINVNTVFYMAQAAIPALRRSGNGCFIAVGSRQGVEPAVGVGAYGASKAAAVSLVRTIALENKDAGMTANIVLPGTMDTPANRKAMPKADPSKWVQSANVASLIVWLASDAGRDTNGAAIPIYGPGA